MWVWSLNTACGLCLCEEMKVAQVRTDTAYPDAAREAEPGALIAGCVRDRAGRSLSLGLWAVWL